jgi:hypothetical protein
LHKSIFHVKKKRALEVDSWEAAIRKAKLKIDELTLAMQTFQENKEAGEPWPERK